MKSSHIEQFAAIFFVIGGSILLIYLLLFQWTPAEDTNNINASDSFVISFEIGEPISIPDGYELLGYSYDYNRGICRHIETGIHYACSYSVGRK